LPQPEGVTHGDGEIANAQFIGVGNGDLREFAAALNLQQGDIALVIAANQFGIELAAIIQLNADFLRLADDVVVG
jgi:hypothetical protein